MELINWDGLSLGSVVAGLIPTPLLYFFGRFLRWSARNKLAGRFFFTVRSSPFYRLCALLVISVLIGLCTSLLSPRISGVQVSPLISGVTFLLVSLICIYFLYAKVGIHGPELSVESGTDYTTSLHLSRNYFWFLGTGASKLSSSKAFEETILRCSHNSGRTRFLLAAPDNKIIREAEQRADAVPNAYRRGIIRSLQILKTLHDDRRANFEVRFYSGDTARDFENFRMFFVDDDILLLSYNVYGRGDGRKTPQLVIRKGSVSGESEGFYHAYRSYYERLWASSRIWDFREYL